MNYFNQGVNSVSGYHSVVKRLEEVLLLPEQEEVEEEELLSEQIQPPMRIEVKELTTSWRK